MKKSGCGKKPASKGYRMSCGGGVKRYAEGKKVKGKRPVPVDVGARPDRPSPEVMQDKRSERQAHQNMAKQSRGLPQRQKASTLSPEEKQRMLEQLMDAKLQEAARKPPNQRGYRNGGQIKRKLLKALRASRGR